MKVFKEMLDIPDEVLSEAGVDLPPEGGVVFGDEADIRPSTTKGKFADPAAAVFGTNSDKEVRRTAHGD